MITGSDSTVDRSGNHCCSAVGIIMWSVLHDLLSNEESSLLKFGLYVYGMTTLLAVFCYILSIGLDDGIMTSALLSWHFVLVLSSVDSICDKNENDLQQLLLKNNQIAIYCR